MRRISGYPVKGKKILLRVDCNCAIENGRIVPGERIEAHSKTIKELAARGARIIVLAHQGRKGGEDFMTLKQHAGVLSETTGISLTYVDNLVEEKAKKAIESLKDGEVLLLENVRMLDCETMEEGSIVKELSPLADYFVLDALSVAHRAHSSVVGFARKLPSFYGDVLADEVKALESLRHVEGVTFVLGGSKGNDSFGIMKNWLREGKAKKVLIGGALSILFLKAKGFQVGESNEYLEETGLNEHFEDAKKMLAEFGNSIELPEDVGLNIEDRRVECDSGKIANGKIFDIGRKTAERYARIISESEAVVMNGPVGVYEMEEFAYGTRRVLEAIMHSKAFSLIGGGHTISALAKFGMDKKKFGYVSLSGKALIKYLSGKELPGIKALEENEKKFRI
ncbi:phosphoglycerate kinase [Candidatus Micrarchaeota archaeon]|nr:phosphoglycerate kinase [Candidatus Micrarchaeota archaeon]